MIITYKTFTFEVTSKEWKVWSSLETVIIYTLAIVEAPLRLKSIEQEFHHLEQITEYIQKTIDAHLDNFGGVAHQFRNKAHDKIEIYPHRTAKGGDKT